MGASARSEASERVETRQGVCIQVELAIWPFVQQVGRRRALKKSVQRWFTTHAGIANGCGKGCSCIWQRSSAQQVCCSAELAR